MTPVFLHADPFVPRCQIALVQRALARTFGEGAFRLAPPARHPDPPWDVAPAVAGSLLAKLGALGTDGALYLDARLFLPGDLVGLLAPGEGSIVADADTLQHVRLMHVRRASSGWDPARGYAELSQATLPDRAPFPAPWMPTPFFADPQARVVDTCALQDRPWSSPFAPAGAVWTGCLRDALADGDVTPDDLRADVDESLLRPSLPLQLELGIADPRHLPAELLDLDLGADLAELRSTAEQRDLLASPAFHKHQQQLRWRNKAKVKGHRAIALRQALRSVKRLGTAPRRLLQRVRTRLELEEPGQ